MSETITINGNDYEPEVVTAGLSALTSNRHPNPTYSGLGGADVTSDGQIQRWQGQQYDGERDIFTVLGYDELDSNTALEKYRAKYERQDIAQRVVDVFPEETWKNTPELVDEPEQDTSFQSEANQLLDQDLVSYLERLDKAQRLGEFAVMVIGLNDGQDLDKPVNTGGLNSPEDISYYNIFPQLQVESWTLGKESQTEANDTSHERYNKPVFYTLDFSDIDAEGVDDELEEVHYSRVIHVAEGALETDLKGKPALKSIYNRLDDRLKVIGASAEMFYTGADRKIIANVKDDFALQSYDDSGDREDFKAQLSRVINDLQQAMVSTGMEYEVIDGQEVNPEGVIKQIDTSIASAVGLPLNKLRGNETGERSTTQDRLNWFDTISSRQSGFAGPRILRPVINRLVEFGILPSPQGGNYVVEWPDLYEPTEDDIAERQNKRASALSATGLNMTLSPEQKLDYLQGGPEAVDVDEDLGELPVNETEEMQAAFESFNDVAPVGNGSQYSEGDPVDTPDGLGVVADVIREDFEDPNTGETQEASSESPLYAVMVEDENVGVGFYKASELSQRDGIPGVDAPEEDLAENADSEESRLGMLSSFLSGNQEGHFEWPESWEKSDTPNRVIALKAFAGMGGSFDGCVREMRGNIASPERFCADFIDRLVMHPYWRGSSWAPGD